MTVEASKETLGFQTEIKQLLHLMIHSLYSHPEVFLRELISNASDAADKLRFAALNDSSLLESDPNLDIRISFDKEAKTITIADNGIGMNRQEVIDNLGTIAKSGTGEFLKQMTGDQQKDARLIGQFGVGFYSAFIVADKVTVETRKAGEQEGVRWISEGTGEFSVESVDREQRGTTVILHLKSEHQDFADGWRLRSVIRKYSDHISLPVLMLKEQPEQSEEDEKKPETEPEWETVNTAKALWCRNRSDISDDEYKEFYKHISRDFTDPLKWSHNKVEGKLEYTSLLYVPSRAPFDLYNRDMQRGLKLYVQRVFIMDEAEQFLPMYLRFIKGVVDSNDLSLNVSRETLQQDPQVENMKTALTKRVLDMLARLAKNDQETYQTFWNEFGQVLKEGPAEDFTNRDKIAALLRFASTHTGTSTQSVSLADYTNRMKEGQEKIYFITAENYNTAANSPHLEVFRKKGIEVLLLTDRVDEWLMSHMHEFDDKSFVDIGRGDLDLDSLDDEADQKAREEAASEHEDLMARIKAVLGDSVEEVRVTKRLTDSPACLVLGQFDMGAQMKSILQAAGQDVPESKPIMEINVDHALITRLDNEPDEDRFGDLVHIIFDQANLATGGKLNDPATYVKRLNQFLIEVAS